MRFFSLFSTFCACVLPQAAVEPLREGRYQLEHDENRRQYSCGRAAANLLAGLKKRKKFSFFLRVSIMGFDSSDINGYRQEDVIDEYFGNKVKFVFAKGYVLLCF